MTAELRIFEGTASSAGRHVTLSDGEFAIVAAMALHNQTLSREEWCDKLWPDRDADASGRLLKVYVHRVRVKFGTAAVIQTQDNGYRFGSDCTVDVHQLEAIVRNHAAESARLDGEALAVAERGFESIKNRGYRRIASLDHFDELERRFVTMGAELARLIVGEAFARGDSARAARVADELVGLDPYDEVAAELFIRAQLFLGRKDAAARHFRSFCRTLRDELDVPPPRHLTLLFA